MTLKQAADTLIIANLSRFSRDREHQSAIKKRVEKAGARLVFCDMSFEDTPEGDLMFGIAGSFAAYERQAIKERTMKGRRRRAEQGVQPARNHSPFGYHVVTHKDVLSGAHPPDTLGTYQVVEEQAARVREMFARVAEGASVRGVARWLTQSGVPTPRGAICWNDATLLRLLQHPVYKGVAAFGRFERRHDEGRAQRGLKTGYTLVERPQEQWVCIEAPALVDEATWDAVQGRIKQNKALRGRPDRKYLLTGLMRCPVCGEKMRSNTNRRNPKNKQSERYHLYECRFARPSTNAGGKVCCNARYRGYHIEPLVTRTVQEAARRSELATAAVEAHKRAQASEGLQPDVAALQQQLADLQKQEQATVKGQIAGIMAGADASIYEGILSDLAKEREQVCAALKRAGYMASKDANGRDEDDAAIITRAIAEVDDVLNAPDHELTPGEKQGLLARIIEAIYPEGADSLKIVLKPFSPSVLNDQYVTT